MMRNTKLKRGTILKRIAKNDTDESVGEDKFDEIIESAFRSKKK